MNIKQKVASVLSGVALIAGFAVATAPVASAAPPCVGTWTVGVGGLNDNTSQSFANLVNQRVGYNSYDTRAGVNELNRLVREHRRVCFNDHIKIIGHSGGAAVVHVWASENGRTIGGRTNVIALADPKRPAGPGGPGFAATDFPFNTIPTLAGADANYGGLPFLQVCNSDDHICNSQSGWNGYAFGGRHGAYDFNPRNYSNNANGQIYR